MKRSILILIFTLSGVTGIGQTTPWISSGATWYYKWTGVGQGGYDKIEYTNDSLILGKTCEVLKTTSYTFIGPPLTLFSTSTSYHYTYSSGDTVFYYLDSAFEVLYNFGLAAGETWDIGVDSANYCSRSVSKVDSTSMLTIASMPHRVQYVSDSSDSSVGIQGAIIEHIGSMDYLFPLQRFCGPGVVDYYDYYFSCFSDSAESYLLVPAADCTAPYHVGISESTASDLNLVIYPNPAENEIYVRIDELKELELSVINAFGQIVLIKQIDSQEDKINIENLSPGVYFLRLKSENGNIKNGIFVKLNQ